MADGSLYRSHAATPHDAWDDDLTPAPVPERIDPPGVPGGNPPDMHLWFGRVAGNYLWFGPKDDRDVDDGQPAAAAILATAPALAAPMLASTVRCCVPPAPDIAHDPYCPVYGYPRPPDGRPRGTAATVEQTRDLTEDARRAVGQSPVLSYGDMVPDPVAGVGWADLAEWAHQVDRRFTADEYGMLWCGAGSKCRHADTAAWEPTPGYDYMRGLVIFLALHWGCHG